MYAGLEFQSSSHFGSIFPQLYNVKYVGLRIFEVVGVIRVLFKPDIKVWMSERLEVACSTIYDNPVCVCVP